MPSCHKGIPYDSGNPYFPCCCVRDLTPLKISYEQAQKRAEPLSHSQQRRTIYRKVLPVHTCLISGYMGPCSGVVYGQNKDGF